MCTFSGAIGHRMEVWLIQADPEHASNQHSAVSSEPDHHLANVAHT